MSRTDRNTYNTKQRDEIVEFFSRHRGGCFTAKELIRSGEITVGEATVYRTLSRLANQGVLKRYTGDGAGASYQLNESEECSSHFHLKCERCQRLIHMDCEFMTDMKKHIECSHNFSVDIGKTVIYGLCAACTDAGAFGAKAAQDAPQLSSDGDCTDAGALGAQAAQDAPQHSYDCDCTDAGALGAQAPQHSSDCGCGDQQKEDSK